MTRNSTQRPFSHLNQRGETHMVDICDKSTTARTAIVEVEVKMNKDTLQLIVDDKVKKGDVLNCARIAGIMAAKKTAELIPMCHPIALEGIDIELQPRFTDKSGFVDIRVTCKTSDKTGVEMESLTAASITALTIYDMCKSHDRGMQVNHLQLHYKDGGKSGTWQRNSQNKR